MKVRIIIEYDNGQIEGEMFTALELAHNEARDWLDEHVGVADLKGSETPFTIRGEVVPD